MAPEATASARRLPPHSLTRHSFTPPPEHSRPSGRGRRPVAATTPSRNKAAPPHPARQRPPSAERKDPAPAHPHRKHHHIPPRPHRQAYNNH